MERLPAQDRFWVLNALGATYLLHRPDRRGDPLPVRGAGDAAHDRPVAAAADGDVESRGRARHRRRLRPGARTRRRTRSASFPRYNNPQLLLYARVEPRRSAAGHRRAGGGAGDRRRRYSATRTCANCARRRTTTARSPPKSTRCTAASTTRRRPWRWRARIYDAYPGGFNEVHLAVGGRGAGCSARPRRDAPSQRSSARSARPNA